MSSTTRSDGLELADADNHRGAFAAQGLRRLYAEGGAEDVCATALRLIGTEQDHQHRKKHARGWQGG